MSFYKIIKAAEVPENLLHVLPLRSYTTLVERESVRYGDNNADVAASIMDQATLHAEEIVSQARVSADEIIDQAKSAAGQIEQEAYRSAFEKGRQAGYEAGYRDGMAQADQEAAAIRAQAGEVLAQAETIRRQTLAAMDREIVDLAREIAEKLLSAQLTLEPGMVLQVSMETLRLVADRLNVVLYINPVELELVERRKDELLGVLPVRAQLQVVADPSVQAGGCRVETEQGQVDATMETRREELIKALYMSER